MKTWLIALLTASALAVPAAQAQKHDDEKQLLQMEKRMEKMYQQMDRIRQAKDPKEHDRLLEEHMQTMQEQMQEMRGMGSDMMMGMSRNQGRATRDKETMGPEARDK